MLTVHRTCRNDFRKTHRAGETNKWLIGCGGAIVVALLLCAGVAFWAVPQFVKLAEDGMAMVQDLAEKEMERERRMQKWRAPAADPLELFPQAIGDYTMTGEPDVAVPSDYGMTRAMPHASYSDGVDVIDVYLTPMSEEEKRATYTQLTETFSGPSPSNGHKAYFGSPDLPRFYFSMSPPARIGWASWQRGWFAMAVDQGYEDPEPFLFDFLDAISAEEPETPEGDTSEEGTTPPEDAEVPTADDAETTPSEAESSDDEGTAEPSVEAEVPELPDVEGTPESNP